MLKETLERFREKFKSKTCDCDSICEIHKIEEYEQFITEEIKLAFQAGKDSMREEIFDFIMKNLYNEQTCKKINEFFNKIK